MPKHDKLKLRYVERLLTEYCDNGRVLELLSYSVGRVLLKTPGEAVDLASRVERERRDLHVALTHITDWLVAAVANEETWLENTDALGRPKKLMKFADIAAISAEADKAMLIAANRGGQASLSEGHEALHFDLGDGFTLVRLLTPEALDVESRRMQHCIGGGAYDARVTGTRFVYLSLRDEFGKAHATIELDEEKKAIVQFQGKQNLPPAMRYGRACKRYFAHIGIYPDCPTWQLGFVLDKDGVAHDLTSLPEGLTVEGDLDLAGCPADIVLPRNLTVSGRLKISATTISEIAEGTRLGGLQAYKSVLARLPFGLVITGTMDIDSAMLKELPGGLHIHGHLCLDHLDIDAIPDDLRVDGRCSISDLPITSFPATARIGGDLFLTECANLRSLPEALDVEGDLLLTGSGLEQLPERLRVKGNLDIGRTKIRTLPAKAEIGGGLAAKGSLLAAFGEQTTFRGLVDLTETPIEAIPDGFSSAHGLILTGSAVKTIGGGLRTENLIAPWTAIRKFPLDASVNGIIDFHGSELEDIPPGITHRGRLDIGKTRVTAIPDDVMIHTLNADDLVKLSIGRDLRVVELLTLHNAEVIAWEGPATIGTFEARSAVISALPGELTVSGDMRAEGAAIGTWPETLEVGGFFDFTRGTCGRMPGVLSAKFDASMHGVKGVSAPRVLRSGGNAFFEESRFRNFPEEMAIDGSALFSNSNIRRIPASYDIARHLIILRCPDTVVLENGLSVGMDMHLPGPADDGMPTGASCGGRFTRGTEGWNLFDRLSSELDIRSWHPRYNRRQRPPVFGDPAKRPKEVTVARPPGR